MLLKSLYSFVSSSLLWLFSLKIKYNIDYFTKYTRITDQNVIDINFNKLYIEIKDNFTQNKKNNNFYFESWNQR